jgi:hypothetical protein
LIAASLVAVVAKVWIGPADRESLLLAELVAVVPLYFFVYWLTKRLLEADSTVRAA